MRATIRATPAAPAAPARPVGQVAQVALAPLTALAMLLTTASCTGTRDDAIPEPDRPAGDLAWEDCSGEPGEVLAPLDLPSGAMSQLTRDVTYECATLAVPRDWADPDGDTFEIALLRARHDDQRDRLGSLLINPGGPGGSGVDLAVYLSFGPAFGGLPTEVTERFDIVGFDPRGVKRSSPVKCFSDADLEQGFGADPDPVTQDEFDAMVADSQRMAQACQAEYGESLGHFSTNQTARDMEAIRRATGGDDGLTYLGFSYGTRLGAVYAHLFPDRVRAMVLDGAVDPAEDPVEASRGQAEGFEQAVDSFAEWCAGTPRECPLQPDARTAISQAIEGARGSPAVGEGGREATPGWIFYAVVAALYSEQTWPVLAAALDQLEGGDPAGVFELADSYAERSPDGEYSNLFDANTAITCADDDSTRGVADVRALQAQWREDYPLFGAPLATSLINCQVWPAEPDPPQVGEADGAPPILVVGTTGDPATPYELAPRMAEVLGVGVLLTYEGEGHTAYPGSACVNDAVAAYLIDLTVPDDGAVCD